MGHRGRHHCRSGRRGPVHADAQTERRTGRSRQGDGRPTDEDGVERQRRGACAPNAQRGNTHHRHPAARRGSGPVVRDLGQNRRHKLPGRFYREARTVAGQGERPPPASPAATAAGPGEAGRGPCVPAGDPAQARCRQPGSLRAGQDPTWPRSTPTSRV